MKRSRGGSLWSSSPLSAEYFALQLGHCAEVCRLCDLSKSTRSGDSSHLLPPEMGRRDGHPHMVTQGRSVGSRVAALGRKFGQLSADELETSSTVLEVPTVEHFAQLSRQLLHEAKAARVRKAAAASAAEVIDVLHWLQCEDSTGGQAEFEAQLHTEALIAHGSAHTCVGLSVVILTIVILHGRQTVVWYSWQSHVFVRTLYDVCTAGPCRYWERLLLVWVFDAALLRLHEFPTEAIGCRDFTAKAGPIMEKLTHDPTTNVREASALVLSRVNNIM